jgi:hypothetical protein
MKSFNVFGGEGKVPTGTYVSHNPNQSRYDVSNELAESKIKWCFDGSGTSSIYFDDAIPNVFSNEGTEEKYGWLLESKSIIPHIYSYVENNLDSLLLKFSKIFTSDRSLYSLDERIIFIPANTLWVKQMQIYPKTKLISMISSHKNMTVGHSLRLTMMNDLHGRIDIFGQNSNPISVKEDGLKDYMFSVAIENSSYETYFTEKILDCFATGTIPIYWGAPDILNYFNPEGIILLEDFNLNDLSENLYFSKIEAVKENFELSKQYKFLENFVERYLCE